MLVVNARLSLMGTLPEGKNQYLSTLYKIIYWRKWEGICEIWNIVNH